MKPYIDESWYVCPSGVGRQANAGGVVCCQGGSGSIMIALIQEKGYPGFVLPKGGVLPDETPQDAARREIAEETGLSGLILLGDLGCCERLNFEKTSWNCTHYFLYGTADIVPIPGLRGECNVHWYSLDRLPPMFWPEQSALVRTRSALICSLCRSE